MKQKLILLGLVMGLTIVSQSSLSLGMGKIQVYSALNEPLQSSIDLLANTDEELMNLEVSLASSEDYQKVGLDKSFVPANIMVSFDEENPYQINVTSNGPVSEPIVSLLLDVNWNNGRILREFTVLLDPPVYESSNNSAPVNNVVVEPIEDSAIDEMVIEESVEVATEPELNAREEQTRTVTNEDFAASEEQVAAEETPSYTENTSASEVYVESGDTLWRIANNNKVGDLSANQMMIAIYNKNPSAFIDNNINRLIEGSRLDIPSYDEADNIGFSEAMAQVESHHQSWSPAQQDYSAYQTEDTAEDDYQAPESSLDYGVQLSGGDNQGSDGGQSNADQGNAAEAQAIEEDLYNKEAENTDLKERISELEGIVEQQQDAIEISDDGLANLENQLDNAAEETTEAIDDTVDTTVDTADDIWDAATDSADDTTETESQSDLSVDAVDFEAGDGTDSEDSQLSAVESETASEPVDTVESDSATIPATPEKYTPAKQESFIDTAISWVMSNLMWVLIGLGGLIALLVVPKLLSGSDDEEEDGTSFLDDIKNRKASNEASESVPADESEGEEHVDSVETKMNKPLQDDSEEDGDVLAELDRSIDFDESTSADSDVDMETSEDDELTELNESGEFTTVEDDDGFDLDGFLNDENDDITETKDHSETLADVNFDDQDNDSSDDVENELSDDADSTVENDDMSFDDFDLDLDDEIEDLSDEVKESADDLLDKTEDAAEEVADKSAELVETVSSEADEFSFDDDEDFDFNLDDELEELSNEDEAKISEADSQSEAGSEVDEQQTDEIDATDSDDFNDMLDISEEDSETFEITEEDGETAMDEEIDLGLEDLMDDSDAIDTKLDLAKAYIDMGDSEGAKNLLDEIISEGTEEQVAEAKKLLDN